MPQKNTESSIPQKSETMETHPATREDLPLSNSEREEKSKSFVIQTVEEVLVSRQFSGPIPPAEELKKYKQVEKTAPDRIIKMAEKQQEAMLSEHQYITKVNGWSLLLGHIFGFIIALLFISAGFWLLHEGRPVEGFTSLIGTGAALVGLFIAGRAKDKTGERSTEDSSDKAE